MPTPPKVLIACCLLAACGHDPLEARGRYRLTSIAVTHDDDALRAALAEHTRMHGSPAAIFANGLDAAAPAFAASAAQAHVVTIGPAPGGESALGGKESIVVDETGARAAVELALLACAGIDLPERVALGTRVFTPANVARGGTARPGPGDFVLEMLRRQHAEILSNSATNTTSLRMGLVQARPDDPWQARVAAELRAAAELRPGIALALRVADGDVAKQNDTIRGLVDDGCRVVFVIPDDPTTLAEVAAAARARKVAIVVLDRQLRGDRSMCCIGADQTVIGRAAGETIAGLLPNGGAVVELWSDVPSPLHRLRHEGFTAALEAK